jgi:hypothetical protein
MNVPVLTFGMYDNYPVDKVPFDYLFWLFPNLTEVPARMKGAPGRWKQADSMTMYGNILEWFLTQDMRMEDHSETGEGYCFYFNAYKKLSPEGKEIPFLRCMWRGKNSEGKWVYETEAHKFHWFFESDRNGYHLSTKYVSHEFTRGAPTMVYERNPNFYFIDGNGRTIPGAFLMRKPLVEENRRTDRFWKNKHINNLQNGKN